MLPHPSASSPVWLLLCWLATWRLTTLLCYEAGPFDAFSWLRLGFARIGLGRLVACFHCMSFWVSLAAVLLAYEWRPRSAILVLAIAGATSLTERLLGAGDGTGRADGPPGEA